MKILFGSHYGKDISELDSGYIIWIIEKFEKADWLLINECKKELSERLKLDWELPTDTEKQLRIETNKQASRINQLEQLLSMSIICQGNQFTIEMYERSPQKLQSDLNLIKELQL